MYIEAIGVDPGGLRVSLPPDFGLGVVGSQRAVDGCSEITIAYFAQKVCRKVISLKKKREIGEECRGSW